jgi:hypothetical protein
MPAYKGQSFAQVLLAEGNLSQQAISSVIAGAYQMLMSRQQGRHPPKR